MIPLGFGKISVDVDSANIATIGLLSNVTSTFSILAAVLSKTSFAVTLLRITTGYVKVSVWFIIGVMNIAMGLNAIITWVKCNPVHKSWDQSVPGTCWDANAVMVYSIFAAGKFCSDMNRRNNDKANGLTCSRLRHLGCDGRHARPFTLAHRLEPTDEAAGEMGRCPCHEHGYLVCISSSFRYQYVCLANQ